MPNKDPQLKDIMYEALFGRTGSLTMGDFRIALSAIIDNLLQFKKEMRDKVDTAIAGIKNGKDGKTPTDTQLLALIRPLIPKVSDGHTPTEQELLALIRPLIPTVKDGITPTDARLRKLIAKLLPVLEKTEPDTGAQIVGKINTDKSGALIAREHVEGLAVIEDMVKTANVNAQDAMRLRAGVLYLHTLLDVSVSGITNGQSIKWDTATSKWIAYTPGTGGGLTMETPSGLVNGSNVTYTVTSAPQYIVVDGVTYFENNGYTRSSLTITTSVQPVGFIRSFY